MNQQLDVSAFRSPDHEIHDQFWRRWSPRAMSGEPVTQETMMRLFEAARWAPSCFNEQPWRFVYALRDTAYWQPLFDFMGEFNQAWAAQAGALVLVLSKNNFSRNGKTNSTHSLDAGAAWMSLALQGSHMGLVVHGMAGFDHEAARTAYGLPEDVSVEMMIAVGHPGDPAALPEDIRAKEQPSNRLAVGAIAFEGGYQEG